MRASAAIRPGPAWRKGGFGVHRRSTRRHAAGVGPSDALPLDTSSVPTCHPGAKAHRFTQSSLLRAPWQKSFPRGAAENAEGFLEITGIRIPGTVKKVGWKKVSPPLSSLPLSRRMQHKPARSDGIVLKQLLRFLPRSLLNQPARKTGVDAKARTFSVLSHLAAMLFAQLSHAISLNDFCDWRQPGRTVLRGSLRWCDLRFGNGSTCLSF